MYFLNQLPPSEMYEGIISYLLGKTDEMSEEDLTEFIGYLCKELDIFEKFGILEQQNGINNVVNSKEFNLTEKAIIKNAVSRILDQSSQEDTEEDILVDKSEDETPFRNRKVKRGKFSKSTESIKETKNCIKEKKNDSIKEMKNDNIKEMKSDNIKEMKTLNEAKSNFKNNATNNVKLTEETLKKNKINESAMNDELTLESNFLLSLKKINAKIDNNSPFNFEIGELEENHHEGPKFNFEIDN